MRNLKRCFRRIICVMAIMLCLSTYANAVSPSQAIVNLVKAEVESAQYSLPIYVNQGLQLTKVWYIPEKYTIAYKYVFDFYSPKLTNQAIYEAKQGIVHLLKATPNSKDMTYLTNGITFHYNYYNPDGTFLYAIKITPTDVK